MTKTEFVPLTAESALEHVRQGNAERLYYLRQDRMFQLVNASLLFMEVFDVKFFLRTDREW